MMPRHWLWQSKNFSHNPERMQKFAEAAYKKAQSFNIENLTEKLLDVYEQAIRDKKKNRFVTVNPPEFCRAC